jgi:hypothetical protein
MDKLEKREREESRHFNVNYRRKQKWYFVFTICEMMNARRWSVVTVGKKLNAHYTLSIFVIS